MFALGIGAGATFGVVASFVVCPKTNVSTGTRGRVWRPTCCPERHAVAGRDRRRGGKGALIWGGGGLVAFLNGEHRNAWSGVATDVLPRTPCGGRSRPEAGGKGALIWGGGGLVAFLVWLTTRDRRERSAGRLTGPSASGFTSLSCGGLGEPARSPTGQPREDETIVGVAGKAPRRSRSWRRRFRLLRASSLLSIPGSSRSSLLPGGQHQRRGSPVGQEGLRGWKNVGL